MIERISQRSVFRSFGRGAARSKAGPITVVRGSVDPEGRIAAAYAIPRTVGPAVVRNRLRRQLKVVLTEMEQSGSLNPGMYLIVVRPGAKGAAIDLLREWLSSAIDRLTDSIGETDGYDSSNR